jgi:Domain of unknown function (DUF4160)
MPTLLRQNGFDFVIRTRDHTPPPVHVFRGGTQILLFIALSGNAPSIREVRSMNRANVRQALEIAAANNEMFYGRWREIYG